MLSGPGRVKQLHHIRFTYPGTFVRHPRRHSFHSMRRTSMTTLRRSMTIVCLFLGVLVLAPNSWAQTRPPILEQIAKTYGIDSWDQVQAIRYTWNGEIPGVFKLAHAWEWEPKTNKVSYEGKDKDGKPVKVSYMRS